MARILFLILLLNALVAKASYCLSENNPPLSGEVQVELALKGIKYIFGSELHEKRGAQKWQGGVQCLSNFNEKAPVFIKWIKMAQFRPHRTANFERSSIEISGAPRLNPSATGPDFQTPEKQ